MSKPDSIQKCRRCLNSYLSQNILMKHKRTCEKQEIRAFKTSNESRLYWKKHFHDNPIYVRVYGEFGADNQIDKSSERNKTTNVYEQNAVCNDCHIMSELNNVVQNGYFEASTI